MQVYKEHYSGEGLSISCVFFVFKTHDRKLEMEQKEYQKSSGCIVSFETIWQGNLK